MTPAALSDRVQRLEQLVMGLFREVSLIRTAFCPLLYLERRAYLDALHDTIAGAEAARVVLAKALQRLDERADDGPMSGPRHKAHLGGERPRGLPPR
jgi:hypothetical protein